MTEFLKTLQSIVIFSSDDIAGESIPNLPRTSFTISSSLSVGALKVNYIENYIENVNEFVRGQIKGN